MTALLVVTDVEAVEHALRDNWAMLKGRDRLRLREIDGERCAALGIVDAGSLTDFPGLAREILTRIGNIGLHKSSNAVTTRLQEAGALYLHHWRDHVHLGNADPKDVEYNELFPRHTDRAEPAHRLTAGLLAA